MLEKNDTVTKKFLEERLLDFRRGILDEVRIMIFENSETMKVYYKVETERYMQTILQKFQDGMRAYGDQIKSLGEKIDHTCLVLDDHEKQISALRVGGL